MRKIIKILFIFQLVLIGQNIYSQDRYELIDEKLTNLATSIPGLNQTIEFSSSGATFQEFVRAVGINNKINISVDPSISAKVVNNFSGVKAKDIILFLCKEYNLDINLIGSIISIHKYSAPVKVIKYIPKKINVNYSNEEDLLSLDLQADSLYLVTKAITDISGKNIILSPEIKGNLVSAYIKNMPFDATIEKFAYSNGLKYSLTDDGFYLLSKIDDNQNRRGNPKSRNKISSNTGDSKLIVKYKNNLLSIEAIDVNISDLVSEASIKSGKGYYLLSPIDKKVTIVLHDVSFEEFLLFVLTGSEFSYAKNDDIFMIGKKDDNGLKLTKVIQLQHRSVVDFVSFVPANLKKDLEIIEFKEQNSIIVNGIADQIKKLEQFVLSVDKVVPMVVIDVLIIDNKSNYNISTGISAGISDAPVQESVKLLPELNVTVGAQTINSIINSFNGYGFVNLGKVTPNFYLSIKALESNGVIKVNSTPKLSTLNGSEAELTLGNTTYYYEERNDVITNQSTQNIVTKQYKPLKADFKVTIKPIVSGDDQVTLEITVVQSDFTGDVVGGAPPGQVTRSFTSTVRVKNEEMVLLGGLEEKVNSEESTGWPILSRIPIIKWLFSTHSKGNKSSKLNIFIKPTIIY